MKKIQIVGGGTFSHIRSHLALAAMSFGSTAIALGDECDGIFDAEIFVHLTKMADPWQLFGNQPFELITNEDVSRLVDTWMEDKDVGIIFFNAAMCDFDGEVAGKEMVGTPSGKYEDRLSSSKPEVIFIHPQEKVIRKIKKARKDIFLVGFKTTCGGDEEEMLEKGMNMLKNSECDLVLINDVKLRQNMIISSEGPKIFTEDRELAIKRLVEITHAATEAPKPKNFITKIEEVT